MLKKRKVVRNGAEIVWHGAENVWHGAKKVSMKLN